MMTSVRCVHVGRAACWLGMAGTRALAPALMNMARMAHLNLGGTCLVLGATVRHVERGDNGCCGSLPTGNELGVEGAKALAPALMKMTHMTHLILRGVVH